MKKYIANIITSSRIIFSLPLLFIPLSSAWFYVFYLFCGFTDMIDGTIARKTGTVSEFGTKLDTVADLVFVAAAFVKLLPAIHISKWLWIWGGVIAVIKITNIILGYAFQKQFLSLHTIMNKITGLLLFLLPLTISFLELKYTATVVCSIATVAAIQEGVYVMKQSRREQVI